MKDLEVFIKGELVDLCIPTEDFARESNWHSWFNDPNITKYLEQGLYPNTAEDQVRFFKSVANDRLILILKDKEKNNYLGTISLSAINNVKRKCDVAIVMDGNQSRTRGPFIALEAMARMTEHAFTQLGMTRISAGQNIALAGWQQRMELLGYKLEGLHYKKFVKGTTISDSVTIACLYEDFLTLKENRTQLWDSFENMKKRVRSLPKKSFSKELQEYYDNQRASYYENIFSL